MLHGPYGSEGKSTFGNLMLKGFGKAYVKGLPAGHVIARDPGDPEKPQSGLMEHIGVHMTRIDEANPPKNEQRPPLRMSNEYLKKWTGGDPMPLREMYGKSDQHKVSGLRPLTGDRVPRCVALVF